MSAPEHAGAEPTPPNTDQPRNGEPVGDGGLSATVDALSSPQLVPEQRRNLLAQLGRQLPRPRLWRPRTAVRWVADTVSELAPQIPVRDLDRLREHHPGLAGDALASRLIRNAARATAGIGAVSGGLAAIKWAAPPTLLTAPALLGAETVAVVAIEVKLVGELHEAYERPLAGTPTQRAGALLQSWTQQRGIDPLLLPSASVTVLRTTARNQLAERLARRFGRNLPTLAPLLAGAVIAGYLNRRATRAVGGAVAADLGTGSQ